MKEFDITLTHFDGKTSEHKVEGACMLSTIVNTCSNIVQSVREIRTSSICPEVIVSARRICNQEFLVGIAFEGFKAETFIFEASPRHLVSGQNYLS